MNHSGMVMIWPFSIFFRPVARAFGWADNVLAETLYDRLEKRHYPESKVKQNVEAGPKDVLWGSAQAGAGEHRASWHCNGGCAFCILSQAEIFQSCLDEVKEACCSRIST